MTSQNLAAVASALIVRRSGHGGERIEADGYARQGRLQHRDGSVVQYSEHVQVAQRGHLAEIHVGVGGDGVAPVDVDPPQQRQARANAADRIGSDEVGVAAIEMQQLPASCNQFCHVIIGEGVAESGKVEAGE